MVVSVTVMTVSNICNYESVTNKRIKYTGGQKYDCMRCKSVTVTRVVKCL